MLKIRLQRTGKKNSPSYRIVLCEHTSPPQGKFIEILGHYNPRLKQKGFKKNRVQYWISKGAQVSPTVHNLLVGEGIIDKPKIKAWRPKKRSEAKPEKRVDPVRLSEVAQKSKKDSEKSNGVDKQSKIE